MYKRQVFSDGVNAGAMLDRNGLRPARYTLTTDDIFILASEKMCIRDRS